MPSEWVEKFERGFLKYVWEFNKKELPKMHQELKNHQGKVAVVLKTTKQAKEYLNLM